jgi:hypothetical protein
MPNPRRELSLPRTSWCHLPKLLLVLTLVLLFGCTGEVTVNYNPVTQIATLTGKVRGKTKRITQTANCPGTFMVDIPDCGKFTVTCTCSGPVTTTIECGDPLLAQVPTSWTFQDGTFTSKTGSSGKILVSDAATFKPPTRGPIITDPGFKAVVVKADAIFPDGDELDVKAMFATGADATGVTLKAIDTAIVTFAQKEKTCSEPALEIADAELAPNFRLINDAAHRLVVQGTGTPAGAPTRTFPTVPVVAAVALLLVIVVVILLWRKRSASA